MKSIADILHHADWSTESLERIKAHPQLVEAWLDQKVRIWSDEHKAYWRDPSGYTPYPAQAGVFPFPEAWKKTRHCGPEKKIFYKLVFTAGEVADV